MSIYLIKLEEITTTESYYSCNLCGNIVMRDNSYVKRHKDLSCGCRQYLTPYEDVTGESINGIQFLGFIKGSMWKVRYSCGHFGETSLPTVKIKRTSLCTKCARKVPTTLKHGNARESRHTSEYNSWIMMRRRCYEKSNNRYDYYGGKGVKVCEQWLHSFETFLEDMGERPEGYSLDRVDVNGDYEPGNCVWSSAKTQANNKTNNILILSKDTNQTMSLRHWCIENQLNYKNAHYRYKYKGDSIQSILGDGYSLFQ